METLIQLPSNKYILHNHEIVQDPVLQIPYIFHGFNSIWKYVETREVEEGFGDPATEISLKSLDDEPALQSETLIAKPTVTWAAKVK